LLFIGCKEEFKLAQKGNESISVGPLLLNLNNPTQGKSHLPRLKVSGNKLYMTWVEQEDSLAILKYASYDQDKWSTARTITSGTDWFVNWADFPALAINGDRLLTNILKKSAAGTYDYDVILKQVSLLDTTAPIRSFKLNTDGIHAEHGFVSMQAYDDGYYVSWLDGRDTKNEDASKNQMTLRNAFVNIAGTISQDKEIDARVCDCCNTATAITLQGPIAVYRDRSDGKEEIRDIAITRWVDGHWTTPKSVHADNWQLNGCPVNGPAIDTQNEDVVASWFTAAANNPSVFTAFSNDNGETFGKPVRTDSGNAIGRIDTQFLNDGSALVSWLEPKGADVVLQVMRVHQNGSHDKPITITNTSAERQSGFPQLEIVNKTVYVAWTDLDGENSKVKLVSFQVD